MPEALLFRIDARRAIFLASAKLREDGKKATIRFSVKTSLADKNECHCFMFAENKGGIWSPEGVEHFCKKGEQGAKIDFWCPFCERRAQHQDACEWAESWALEDLFRAALRHPDIRLRAVSRLKGKK